MTRPVPEGYHSVTPTLTIKGASEAIEFYKKAFGANELNRFLGPDGKSIVHAAIKIGDSVIMINDENLQMGCMSPTTVGGASSGIFLYVQDADAVWNTAVSAGAKPQMPMMDAFWGDRFGSIVDPFWLVRAISTHKKDLSPDEIRKAGDEFMKQFRKR